MANKSSNSGETDPFKAVTLEKRGWIAIIRLNVPAKLNALTQPCLFRVASLLHEIAAMDDIAVTVIAGTGRYYSAGADVTAPRVVDGEDARLHWTRTLVAFNMHNTHAWYTHPKILVVAMNGPAVGISAANIAHADFIYAAPHAFLLVPFTSIGLYNEGAASVAMVSKLGQNKANEAMLMSRPLSCPELKDVGFVTKVIEAGGGDSASGRGIDSERFLDAVVDELRTRFDPSAINHYSLLKVKESIRKPGLPTLDAAGVTEVMGGLDVFMKGVPQREFARLARGEKRHKM